MKHVVYLHIHVYRHRLSSQEKIVCRYIHDENEWFLKKITRQRGDEHKANAITLTRRSGRKDHNKDNEDKNNDHD